jgi:protein phosphatase
MTHEEARDSPHRNIITHALGHKAKLDNRMPNIFEITMLEEDRLLLLTDGFFDVVPDADLLRLAIDVEPEDAAARLVHVATERGTTDNVSAVVATAIPRPNLILANAQTSTLSARRALPIIPIAAVAVILAVLLVLALLFV